MGKIPLKDAEVKEMDDDRTFLIAALKSATSARARDQILLLLEDEKQPIKKTVDMEGQWQRYYRKWGKKYSYFELNPNVFC